MNYGQLSIGSAVNSHGHKGLNGDDAKVTR
jgi:hypothetical protein